MTKVKVDFSPFEYPIAYCIAGVDEVGRGPLVGDVVTAAVILDPEKMVKEDPVAKELLTRYLAPMANQSLTDDEARKILEYFRTLE